MSLQGFRSVQRWITKLSKKSGSSNTKRMYLHYLQKYCEFADMNPDELVAKRQQNLTSADRFTRRHAEDRLDRFFQELEEGLSRNTCVLAYNAVRSFYKANYLKLEAEEPPQAWPVRVKPGLTREGLRTMLDCTEKLAYTAYILCQVQSGLGVSDLLGLSFQDVKRQLEAGLDHIHLRLLRGKRKELGFFDTFFGRLSTRALRRYLSGREGLKQHDRLIPYTARGVNKFLKRLSYGAGLEWKVSSHDLRKFFATNLKLARVNDPAFNEALIEYWQGHSLGKVKGAYFVPPVEEQLRLYKLAEKRLELA